MLAGHSPSHHNPRESAAHSTAQLIARTLHFYPELRGAWQRVSPAARDTLVSLWSRAVYYHLGQPADVTVNSARAAAQEIEKTIRKQPELDTLWRESPVTVLDSPLSGAPRESFASSDGKVCLWTGMIFSKMQPYHTANFDLPKGEQIVISALKSLAEVFPQSIKANDMEFRCIRGPIDRTALRLSIETLLQGFSRSWEQEIIGGNSKERRVWWHLGRVSNILLHAVLYKLTDEDRALLASKHPVFKMPNKFVILFRLQGVVMAHLFDRDDTQSSSNPPAQMKL